MVFEINSSKYGIKKVLIDDRDYDKIKNYKWCVHYDKKGNNFYVTAIVYPPKLKRYKISLHRLIMDASHLMEVDHINHDSLDNRKCNLRVCSHSENMKNKRIQKNNKSGFKGVCIAKTKYKSKVYEYWIAAIKVNQEQIYIGRFKTKEEAAEAYNKAALKYFGEFACLNIIGEKSGQGAA